MIANNVSRFSPSKFRGDPLVCNDRLPAALRRALNEAVIDWCPLRFRWELNKLMKAGLCEADAEASLVADLRAAELREIRNFAQHWPARLGAYPHVAAGATVLRYEGRVGRKFQESRAVA